MLGSKSTMLLFESVNLSMLDNVNTESSSSWFLLVPGSLIVFDLFPFLAVRSLMSLMLKVNGNGML